MASAKEIINFTKNRRGELADAQRISTGDATIRGACVNIEQVTLQFNGEHWRSNEATSDPEQKYLGHSLGVIPVGEKTAIVVDFTKKGNPIIGQIRDLTNQKQVGEELEVLTGFSGWHRY